MTLAPRARDPHGDTPRPRPRAARARRRAAATLASGALLAASGAALALAWQAGMWATQAGAVLAIVWIAGLGGWSALHRDPPAPPAPAPPLPRDGTAAALRGLLDQVPVPLVRVDRADAHAINRAARALFATDDRILPVPAAVRGGGAGGRGGGNRLRHEGRNWRVDAVETAAGERLAVLVDIDAEQREAQDRADDEMIDILGHELLNGLSPIVSLADSAVTAAARGDAMLRDILATLARRAEGLEGFTRAYRALSRLPDPVPAAVPLAQLADDLARLFAGRFGTRVALAIAVPPAARAIADRNLLVQAIWALLQNGAEAALAAPAPRRVTLTFAPGDADGRLTIDVCDSGGGIAVPERARIFRPFHTTKPGGSGIGLSLAHRIARAHGGDVLLLPDHRTTFRLRLPAGPAEPRAARKTTPSVVTPDLIRGPASTPHAPAGGERDPGSGPG